MADVVEAVHKLAEHPDAVGELINIGSTYEVTVLELAKRILELTSSKYDIRHIPYEEAYAPGFEDMRRRVPSLEKLNRLIRYVPRYSLDDTLQRVIDYQRKAGENI